MAEMADLTKALDKLEVNPAASSPPKKPHEEEATLQVSGSQLPHLKSAEASPEESKAQEADITSKGAGGASPPKAQEAASPPKATSKGAGGSTTSKGTSKASPHLQRRQRYHHLQRRQQAEGSKEKAEPSEEGKRTITSRGGGGSPRVHLRYGR